MTEVREPNFAPVEDVIAALQSVPGINDTLAERMAAREQMERDHAQGLATIRRMAALTQAEVAKKMGIGQTSVSRIEQREDMLLSTMKHYLEALGADAHIVIRMGEVEYQVALTDILTPRAG